MFLENIICECGLEFVKNRKDKKYCSRKCARKHYKLNKFVDLICAECNLCFKLEQSDYTRRIKLRGEVLYCSRSCSIINSNKVRYDKRILICTQCKKESLVNESSDKDKYCSRGCYFEDQKEILALRARQLGKDSAQKISTTHKKRYADNPECHGMLGKTHSESTKKILSEKRKEWHKYNDFNLSERTRAKISEIKTRRWADGKYDHIKMCFAKGKHFFKKANKESWYRSSWELAYMKYLDGRDDIEKCEYESVRISYYQTDGHKRHYIPDFIVYYKDGRKEIHEIKPFMRKDSETNKRKFKAARKYCKENSIKFKVLTEKYLKHIKAM